MQQYLGIGSKYWINGEIYDIKEEEIKADIIFA